MATEWASPEIERRVTAWHEAGHLIAALTCRHFEVGDPAVDFRSNPRAKAFAAVKKLSGTATPTLAEAEELYAIAIGGRIGEEALERWSRLFEGRTIYPDEAGAIADLAWARGLAAHHQLDEERLKTETRERLAGYLELLVELGDWLWKSGATLVSRAELLALPAVAALHAANRKKTPAPVLAGDVPKPTSGATNGGLWAKCRRCLGLD